MKKLFAALLAAVAVSFAGGALADDKQDVAVTAAPAVTAPADAKVEVNPVAAPAALPVAAVEAAPAAEAAAPAPVPNKGDNAWLFIATALVIMMAVPGLALFYGGLVRAKNMLSVLLQVFAVFSLISVLWVLYGYSIAFTEGRDRKSTRLNSSHT